MGGTHDGWDDGWEEAIEDGQEFEWWLSMSLGTRHEYLSVTEVGTLYRRLDDLRPTKHLIDVVANLLPSRDHDI